MNRFPLISIVILNWNGKDFVPSCIQSAKEQTYPEHGDHPGGQCFNGRFHESIKTALS